MTNLITVEELLVDPDFAQTLVLRRTGGAYNKYGEWEDFSILTESTDAVPVGLSGSVYWYDTGTTLNGESVYYDTSDTYARWNSTTRGWLISLIADEGNESVANYFKLQDYPDTISISGTGTSLDGDLPFNGFYNSKPLYLAADNLVAALNNNSGWVAQEFSVGEEEWLSASASYLPPETWPDVSDPSGFPAPTITYTIPTDKYNGQGAWSGTIILSSINSGIEYSVFGAWQKATEKELAQIDLGEIKQEVRKLLSITEIKVSEDDDKLSDRLIWNGKRYKVLRVGDNKDNGYYRAFASFEGVE